MTKIRVGVVGVGHLGSYHLQKYGKLPNCVITGLADINEEKATLAGKTYGCPALTDYRQLIGRVDAVSIAVPTEAHYPIAKAFLQAGVDVLLEKPMTATLSEADELIAIATSQRRILQIGMIERFNPAVCALARLDIQPLFIEAHRLHPFLERGTDIDVVLDLMIHELDIILTFVKSPVVTLESVGVAVLSEKYDIANARLSFASGCIANVTASRLSANKMQKIRFFERGGYHSVDYQKRDLVSLKLVTNPQGRPEIVDNKQAIESFDPLEEEIRSFLESVDTRKTPRVSGEAGRDALALALRITSEMKTIPRART